MMKKSFSATVFCCVCLLICNSGIIQAAPETTRVSVNTTGGEPDDNSDFTSISSSGQYVAYGSSAKNLVSPQDGGTIHDIFLWDRIRRTTERVSSNSSGGEPDGHSWSPSISTDGRYVAFQSNATDLVLTTDTPGRDDIFVRDRQLNTTERVSVKYNTAGDEPNDFSVDPSISGDGRYVAFRSYATDLLETADTPNGDIFVRDRQLNTTERISVKYNTYSDEPNGPSDSPSISADGRYVAFQSQANDLLQTADTLGREDIFVRDRVDKTTERVSVKYNTASDEPNADSIYPFISADGRYVAFTSYATDLVETDSNGDKDIFVFDRQSKTTELVSINSAGEQEPGGAGYAGALSADGRYVAFTSWATNLVEGDNNGVMDLFRRDRLKGITIRASVNTAGAEQNGPVFNSKRSFSISGGGEYMAFRSSATNLVEPNDILAFGDIFLREEEKEFFWPLFLPQKSKD